MKIEHAAIWCLDIEQLKTFYTTWFNATANSLYHNPNTGFFSYFLTFDSGARLELMQMPGIEHRNCDKQYMGLAHLAFSVGSKEAVDNYYRRMQEAGLVLLDAPRWTGDGYYEFVLMDPQGSRIEITI